MLEIGWIDFSNQDRERVKKIIKRVRPEGQLDELGLGFLRDSISDTLFPGISTLQTRAKYFFIVPYQLLHLSEQPKSIAESTSLWEQLKKLENNIKDKMKKKYQGLSNTGVIGIRTEGNLSTRPSEIYWTGLNTFGIIISDDELGQRISLRDYLSNIAAIVKESPKHSSQSEDDPHILNDRNLGINIRIEGYKAWEVKNPDIELLSSEAFFLEDQMRNHNDPRLRASLIPLIIKDDKAKELLLNMSTFEEMAMGMSELDYKDDIIKKVILSSNFSKIADIIHWIYDDMLQDKFHLEEYKGEFLTSAKDAVQNLSLLDRQNFDINKVMEMSNRVSREARAFITEMWNLIQLAENNFDDVLPQMQNVVRKREKSNKGHKARLTNTKAYNYDVELNKQIAPGTFQYRFNNAKRIFQDIESGKTNSK